MSLTITYEHGNSLYINITNRCSNKCDFCFQNNKNGISDGVDLWLEREPTVSEVVDDLLNRPLDKYEELVFCGFGEPMLRTMEIVEILKAIKGKHTKPVRINTNGQANLFYKKDITPLLEGLVDTISISLNSKNAESYQEICNSDFGEEAFNGLIDFAKKCKKYVPTVVFTVVDVMPKEDIEECRKIALDIDVNFRIRSLI